jgi:type IV pilus assembly protein PilM
MISKLLCRPFAPTRLLALDLGARRVAAAVFSIQRGQPISLVHCVSEELEVGSDRTVLEGHRVEALMRLAGQEHHRGSCRLALSGRGAFVRFTPISKSSAWRTRSSISAEAARAIPLPLANVVWSHCTLEGERGFAQRIFAAIKRDAAASIESVATAARFALPPAIPAGFALRHAFCHNYPEIVENVLVIEIGARSTHLLFVHEDRFFLRTLAFGGDAASRGNVSGGGADSQNPVIATAGFAKRLHSEAARTMLGGRNQKRPLWPVAIYLCGGGSQRVGLAELLGAAFRLPVQAMDPLRMIAVSPAAHNANALAPVMSALVGLAVGVMNGERSTPVLTLTTPARDRGAGRPLKAAFALMATIAVGGLPIARHYEHALEIADKKMIASEGRLKPLRALVTRLAELRSRLERAQAEVGELQALADQRTAWIDFLAELQQELHEVGDVWLEKLQVEPAGNSAGRVSPEATPGRLTLRGCLLDRRNPLSKVSEDSVARVRTLLQLLGHSPRVAAIESERFDNSQPGILRFEFTVAVKSAKLP